MPPVADLIVPQPLNLGWPQDVLWPAGRVSTGMHSEDQASVSLATSTLSLNNLAPPTLHVFHPPPSEPAQASLLNDEQHGGGGREE